MLFVSYAIRSSSRYSSSTAAEAYLDRYPNLMMNMMQTTMGGTIPRTKPVTLNLFPFRAKIFKEEAEISRRKTREIMRHEE